MTFHWADLALTLAIVVAGCAVSYFLLLRRLRQTVSENQREMDRRLSALTEVITSLETRLAESGPFADYAAQDILPESMPEVTDKPVVRETESIAPEIQVAIAAAAVAFLGRNARVQSARVIASHDVVSPWSQQGRVIVQASHNLRSRGR